MGRTALATGICAMAAAAVAVTPAVPVGADAGAALTLSFTADNIESAGQNTADADITVSGPKLPAPITKNVTFTNQDGWMLSYDSLQELMAEAMPHH